VLALLVVGLCEKRATPANRDHAPATKIYNQLVLLHMNVWLGRRRSVASKMSVNKLRREILGDGVEARTGSASVCAADDQRGKQDDGNNPHGVERPNSTNDLK